MADGRTSPGANILIAISDFERFGIIDKLNYFCSLILNADIVKIFLLCPVYLFPFLSCIFYV